MKKTLRARAIPFMLAASLAVSSAALTSCVPLLIGGAAGGTAFAYVAGELQATEPIGMDETWRATLAAVDSLELKVTTKEKDSLSARVVATGAEEKKVTIRLERVADRVTTVRVRVGVFGDEKFSTIILDRIEQNL